MGWDGNGSVVRSNGEFTGENLWDEDRENGRQVTSARHDAHDEDLADAIEKCLNIDGENELAANLKMGANALANFSGLGITVNGAKSSFTPTVSTGGGLNAGAYLKFGPLVVASLSIASPTAGAAGWTIGGLPYAAASVAFIGGALYSVGDFRDYAFANIQSGYRPAIRVTPGQSTLQLYEFTDGPTPSYGTFALGGSDSCELTVAYLTNL